MRIDRSRLDEYDLDENEMLSVDDYHELPDDEKIAYQYMEYTPYYGNPFNIAVFFS